MKGPRISNGSLPCGPTSAGEGVTEALREFLLDTTRKFELLFSRCIIPTQTQSNSNARTSDQLPISLGLDEVPVSHLSPEAFPPNAAHPTMPPNALNGNRLGHVENWLSQNCSFEDSVRRKGAGNLDANSLNCGSLGSSSLKYYGDAKLGDDLRGLLQDMSKALRAWSVRHSLISTRQAVNANKTARATKDSTCDLNSNAQVLRQLGFDEEQEVTEMEGLDLPNQREGKVPLQAQDRMASWNFDGKKRRKSLSLDEQHKGENTALPPLLQKEIGTQQIVNAQEPSSTEVDHTQTGGQIFSRQVHTGFTSTSMTRGNADSPEQRLKSLALITLDSATNYDPRIDVVESPDWLPKGWITELKMRCTGNSAGSRDKYFFDPVSKRRFRSRKEVFSFLATGKLGRYKSRPKIKPLKKRTDQSSSGQAIDPDGGGKSASKGEASDVASGAVSESMPALDIPPVCVTTGFATSNAFLPHRSGQPSEWLMYESLGNNPIPMLERFHISEYSSNKSSSNRNPQWQWIFGNTDGSRRPFMDRLDMGNAAESNKDSQHGVQYPTGEAWAFVAPPKRARKSSKRK